MIAMTIPAAAAEESAKRPNILLILSDDHSVPHVGCYGSPNPKTPALDAFGAQGMRFYRAHTSAPQCAPSRGSIFTGRSPIANDSTRFTQPACRDRDGAELPAAPAPAPGVENLASRTWRQEPGARRSLFSAG
jgi:arylsulfatase A-like enzyme